MAELERSLIVERVKAGLRNARAKGKRLGRPPIFVSQNRLDALRDSGASWRAISKELGVGLGTAHRISQQRSKKSIQDLKDWLKIAERKISRSTTEQGHADESQ